MSEQKQPQRGEIYWSDLEPVKGSEQGGSRPVLIVSNKLMNNGAPFVLGVPITRGNPKAAKRPFNISFEKTDWTIYPEAIEQIENLGGKFANKGGLILCTHARALSKERLFVHMGVFNTDRQMKKVEEAIVDAFGLNACTACETPLRTGSLKCSACKKVHSRTCSGCGRVNPLEYKYCPDCGKEARKWR